MAKATETRRGLVLVLLCLVEFMIALDFSIVNVALPSMQDALGFAPDNLQWVVSAYALTFGGFLILGGRLADLYGRRRMLLGGLVGFGAFSLAGGLAQTSAELVILRGAQGLAAALIGPAALAALTTTFTERAERQKALALWGSALGAGYVSGMIVGGVLTQYAGWRWVLLVNVPIAAALAVSCGLTVRESRSGAEGRHLDLPGAVLITGGVSAIVYGLSRANTAGWLSFETLGVIVAGVVVILGFLAAEARVAQPLVPLSVLRLRSVVVSNSANVILVGSWVGVIFVITLFLQGVHGFSPLRTGLTFAASGVAGFLTGASVGRLAGKPGIRITLTLAGLLQAAAIAYLVTLPADHTMLLVAIGTVVMNTANITAIVMINITATSGLDDDIQGIAGGLLNASQQVGAALGLAVISAIAIGRTSSLATGAPTASQLVDGYRWGLAAAAIVAVLGAAVAWFGVRTPQAAAEAAPAEAAPAETASADVVDLVEEPAMVRTAQAG